MSKIKLFACDNYSKKITDALLKYRHSDSVAKVPAVLGGIPPGLNRKWARGTIPAKSENTPVDKDSCPIKKPPEPAKLDLAQSPEPAMPLIFGETVIPHAENMKDHHTESYSYAESGLVLRRGQHFKFDIIFDRDITSHDMVVLQFQVKEMSNAQFGNGTFALVLLSENQDAFKDPYKWGGYITSIKEKKMSVVAKAACDCPVNKWELSITTKLQKDQINKDTKTYFACDVTFLFNPWCKDDLVFHPDEVARQEYVLNRRANHYCGEWDSYESCEWELNQFEGCVLRGALEMLQRWLEMEPWRMSCPMEVCRSLLVATNKNGSERGILECDTNTSQPIYDASYFIKEAVEEGNGPLPGQSFTCAAVITSLCRSLGLPCRLVTAFNIACMTDTYRTAHRVFDEAGKLYWTNGMKLYHCWVDVWMKRPDLSDCNKYDGWQAIDIYGGGPSPILAIKHNAVVKPYDSDQFYAMLNADLATWRHTTNTWLSCRLKLLQYEPSYFGKKILTKAIGSTEPEDLTERYKVPTLSAEEIESIEKGQNSAENPFDGTCFNPPLKDFKFEVICERRLRFGDPINLEFKGVNTGNEQVSCEGDFSAFSMGVDHTDQKIVRSTSRFGGHVDPNGNLDAAMNIEFGDYKRAVQSYRHLFAYVRCDAITLGYTYFQMIRIRFDYPKVVMNYTREPEGKINVECVLKNILGIPLTNTKLRLLCTKWNKAEEYTVKNLATSQEEAFTLSFDPGDCRLVVLTASIRTQDINSAAEHIFISDS